MTARLQRREHPSVAAAIRAAGAFDYTPVHRSDGFHVLSNGKERLAIRREQRPRSTVWHLVPVAELEAALAAQTEPQHHPGDRVVCADCSTEFPDLAALDAHRCLSPSAWSGIADAMRESEPEQQPLL